MPPDVFDSLPCAYYDAIVRTNSFATSPIFDNELGPKPNLIPRLCELERFPWLKRREVFNVGDYPSSDMRDHIDTFLFFNGRTKNFYRRDDDTHLRS